MELNIQQLGTRLRFKKGIFEVSNKDGSHKISPEKIDRIVLTRGISLSSDVILKAVEHQIDLLVVNEMGEPQARIWSHKFGSIATIRKQQLHFCASIQGSQWVLDMLRQRMEGQVDILQALLRDRPKQAELLQASIDAIEVQLKKFQDLSINAPLDEDRKAQIRGWEGQSSKNYFQCLGSILPQAYAFQKRSRRPAKDMFNCVLNYLYGMLYGHVEIALIKAGIDPYLGVFHRDEHQRPSMVFDMIEGYRAWADTVCLQLIFRRVLMPEMFEPKGKGIWLNKLGKRLVIASMNDFLEEVVQAKGKRRSRKVHLQLDGQELAQLILKQDPEKPF